MAKSQPQALYGELLKSHQQAFDRTDALHQTISRIRLALAVVILVGIWAAWDRQLFAAAWLLLPVAAFLALVLWHQNVRHARERARRAGQWYEAGLARLEGLWPGTGARGDSFVPAEHLYASDLDLFGEGSLFQLLCRARTRNGQAALARWLLEPATPHQIKARQEVIRELTPRTTLREDLALAGTELRDEVDLQWLEAWSNQPTVLRSALIPISATAASTSSTTGTKARPAWRSGAGEPAQKSASQRL